MSNKTRFNTTRRMRLEGFDYHSPGYYFLTVCLKDRQNLFIDDKDAHWGMTPSGEMIHSAILEMEARFPDIQMDTFAIMPNHIHLLVGLSVTTDAKGFDSLVDAMHWIKTVTTSRYMQGVKNAGWQRFNGQLWQEGYHDRIVRNESELDMIRRYIRENPMRWREDEFYDD